MATLRPCLDCGRPTRGSRCPDHTIDPGYRTEHWQNVRALRLIYDGGLCQLDHPGCTGVATTVHLDPSCAGDHRLATVDNTLSACAHCHGVEDGPRASGYGEGGTPRLETQRGPAGYPRTSGFLCTSLGRG